MRVRSVSMLLSMFWMALGPPAQAIDPSAFASAAGISEVNQQIADARKAVDERRFADAGKLVDKMLSEPAFAELDAKLQIEALRFGAWAAVDRRDTLAARDYCRLISTFRESTKYDWADLTTHEAKLESWPEAASSLTTLVTRWPEFLREEPNRARGLVRWVVPGLLRGDFEGPKLALYQALFAARYTEDFDGQPSGYWRDLVAAAIGNNDLRTAAEFAARITSGTVLAELSVDRRFDALVARDPRAFDVLAASQREVARLEAFVAKNPRLLGGTVQLTYSLYNVGQFRRMVEICDAALAKITAAPTEAPAFDDIAQQLNWLYNQKALALQALARWDEALAVMVEAAKTEEHGAPNVSQAINLAGYYNAAGRAREALAVLDRVDWAHGLSPFGRMQLQHERLEANLQLGNGDEAATILAWMHEHANDARTTAQAALLQSGDEDAAAALYIARLRDPVERATALLAAQDFKHTRSSRVDKTYDARWRKMLARADVGAAIDAVGRREKFPIYSLGF